MKKDVIYIDIEDDITSIIEKVKAAQAKIVALVPPKRIGALQSVVNLKLLQRAATGVDKRVVLITNDPSLSGLAAGVAIPVAKNLQSKPEIASIPTLEIDDEDIINGEELSIGELASTAPLADSSLDKKPLSPFSPTPAGPVAAQAAKNAPKKGPKIPNFDTFRKKIFIFGGVGLALILFLVWAIFFASQATVNIAARTTSYNVSKALKLGPAPITLNADGGSAPIVSKELQKTTSVDFTATGKKDVGEKATGIVKFSTDSIGKLGTTIPAGTELTSSGGLTYLTDTSVTLTLSNYSGANTGVTAADRGAKYNDVSGDVDGAPNGIDAAFTGSTAGGTDKTVTVVSVDDIAKAKEKLAVQDAIAIKAELKKQFDKTIIVIDESFVTVPGEPTSSPALDQEATTAKLTAQTKYSIAGILRSDAEAILTANILTQLAGLPNQKVFDTGINKVKFANVTPVDGGFTATLQAVGYVGPKIDSEALAKQLVGKRAGEIQAQVQTIDGVESVDVKLSPFWVTTAPSADKIKIKFIINNDTN